MNFALYPSGPHRFLAFHLIRSQGVQQVPEPREIALKLFQRQLLDSGANADTRIDAEMGD